MKSNRYLLAFLLGLALVLSTAAGLKRMGLPLQMGSFTTAQAAGLSVNKPLSMSSGAGYSIDWSTIDGGGGATGGGSYQMIAVIGQPDAGTGAGGSFTLLGGFLPGTLQPWQQYVPVIRK